MQNKNRGSNPRVKKNAKDVILGLDISTSVVGICGLDPSTGELVFIAPIKFNKDNDFLDKGEYFLEQLIHIVDSNNAEPVQIAFEDFAKKFTGGMSSISTILTLARFNGLVEYLVWKEYGIKPEKLNVRSARKKLGIVVDKALGDKKKQVLNQVKAKLDLEGKDPWVYTVPKQGKNKGITVLADCCEDMADSWVIAKTVYTNKC